MPKTQPEKAERLSQLKELVRLKARNNLIPFLSYVFPKYEANWHHLYIAEKLESFLSDPDARKLALFVPPQHGKSQIASRALPAWLLGQNPDLKIAVASYSASVAKQFSRAAQGYISSSEYTDIFPGTKLADSKGDTMKTAQEFEIVGYAGSMIAVGVTGSLTSRTVDVAIIDDPVKDELEASSPTYRERVFQWYSNVLETRLHNDSKVILIMTRWHEDDLAGRLLEREPEEWDVVHIRAIKTDRCPKEDPRQVGEALWPERHSLERLMKIKELSPSTFDGLYQGDPGDPEGGNIKRSWFVYLDELPKERINWQVYIDGAYTENTKNDPTGILIVGKWQNKVIVRYAESAYLEMPGLIKHIPLLIDRLDLGKPSMRIEPKASGLSLMQMLRSETPYPATAIKGPLVREGKAGREAVASKWIEGEKVLLLRGRWNEEVVHQLTKFGKTAHDEYVDLVGYATNDLLGLATQSAGVRRRN